jgi:hypothetical protein
LLEAHVCVPVHAHACKCKGMTGSTACWKPTLVCLRACVLGNARAPMGVCVCAYGRVGGLCLPMPFCACLCKRMCISVGARPCAVRDHACVRIRQARKDSVGIRRSRCTSRTLRSTVPCHAPPSLCCFGSFLTLCAGIIPRFMCQGGDFTAGNGTGGEVRPTLLIARSHTARRSTCV